MEPIKKANKTEIIAFLSDMMRDENCSETNRLKAADLLAKLLGRKKLETKISDSQTIQLEIIYVGGDCH